MTNAINNVGYSSNVSQVARVQQKPQQEAVYTTKPYPNDAFVSSKKEKKSHHVVAKTLTAAAVVVGGATVARKFLPQLKNYTKVVENATAKEKALNIVATVGDKTMEYATKAINKVKELISKKS